MNKAIQFTFLLCMIICISCSQSGSQSESAAEEAEAVADTATDVSQLTYSDIVAMVFDDEGEGVEWHGEEMPNELTGMLTLAATTPCGEGDCGNRLTLTSSADKAITVIIKGDYTIKGEQGYIPRKYTIAAGETLMIGCSHLCYGGESFEFLRMIVGSEYVVE